MEGPAFDKDFQDKLNELFRWRRDVRRFKADPLPEGLLDSLLACAALSPSVGLSEPWRFVLVEDKGRRATVRQNFSQANAQALQGYQGEQAKLYAGLKLEGLDKAPVQVAVFSDAGTDQGSGLGRKTMPEMLSYSVVAAIQTLWLAARARGVGMGWVSILDPVEVRRCLDLPEAWNLVAYLCLGYAEKDSLDPELSVAGWEQRRGLEGKIIRR
jgi:5,6-dimethylbenzimidazole synthase